MSKIKISPTEDLSFDKVDKKIIYLFIPESVEIIKTTLKIVGEVFTGNVASTEIGTTISPSPDSVIIDFHTIRTINGLDIDLPIISSDGTGPHCIMRLWGGSQWYLPSPRNLFKVSTVNGKKKFCGKFPNVSTSKVLFSFCKLNTTKGTAPTYINLNEPAYAAVDDLLELAGFEGLKSIEEPVQIAPGEIILNSYDYLTNLSLQVGDFSPFWIEPKEFATPDDKPIELPDFSMDINNYLKKAKPDKFGFEVPITVQTNISGVLVLKEFNIDYLIHHRDFRIHPEEEFTAKEKQLSFDWNEERTGVNSANIEINIPTGSKVKYISFDLQGSLAKERLVVDLIMPQSSDILSNFGLLLEKGKSIAQKMSFTKGLNVTGFDIRLNPSSDTIKYKLEIRLDQKDAPVGEIIASKAIEYKTEDKTKNTYFWVKIDLEKPIKISENQICWLVLSGEEGEVIWQMNFFEDAQTFGYFLQNGIWNPLEPYQGKPVGGIFRVYYLPDEFGTPSTIDFAEIWNLTTDPTTIDSRVEVETDLSTIQQNLLMKVNAQSQGSLTISNLLVKYQETPLPPIDMYQ
ncbi:MAG: hypothetical protein V1749_08840 [Candidatus Desantisbacteria bacterium]